MCQVFHTAEGVRQEGCEARQEALLRGLLLGEERSWELFAREQGRLFENALEQVSWLTLDINSLRIMTTQFLERYQQSDRTALRQTLSVLEGLSRGSRWFHSAQWSICVQVSIEMTALI